MSRKALSILWWMIGVFALTFSLLAFLRTRGQDVPGEIFGILEMNPAEVAALAVPVAFAAYSLLLYLTCMWCKECGGNHWASRIPIARFGPEDVDPEHPGGQGFQGVVIGLVLILPMIILVLLGVQYLRGSIYFSIKRGPTELLGMEWLGHFYTATIYSATQGRAGFFRFGSATGPQYYPVLTWIYLCWFIGMVITFGVTLKRIFRAKLEH
ncbi:hypothetical protein JM946_17395 [Steroidobacter sp. S1-65]|uniref:Uncharacterized protein n=1 Tax=Steroidobacter gossypii TaxID=2805490 RepID=A0ABS1WZW4_9GAMM|nr:hypothetical protein [Steroidobacter gossypii]MBM0106507.1 hypothetical protein [Steroidobacter gossypii]